ncbi:bifunctional glycosyltransferase/CDP-glycerol:glycerophosphate glycerophosphotransferase [Priestia megaterium]|uniref:bifunctional glycosyltransferase/CDP-glycerol:glycerophosphate glycerophosphotransferase n=1 Tax=Priestia megaterium TaxID=1404 RepID=UPI000BEDA98C|nr:glycosyltransferase [Priestia megaterium]PEA37619.1 teichoic acid biosynthesis protein B [Priestia megaterium]PEE43112.1 teichoic acid biosynthesis protein B [Priestia megaterium]
MSKYKVTVVIVNYNKEPYISQCIESVINQSLQPIEIIIVDDGSTDNSGIISNRYAVAHPHVRYLTQENNGVSSARNKGLSYAQGEYVAFLDADDYVPADAYERLYKAAVQSDADTAIGNFECFNEYRTWHLAYMKKVFAKGLPAVRHISTHRELHLTPSVSNKLFRRERLLQHKIVFQENLQVGEDLLFTQKSLHLSNKTAMCDYPVLYYRVNEEEKTLSKQTTLAFFEQLVLVQKELKQLYDSLHRQNVLVHIEKRQLDFFLGSLFRKAAAFSKEQLHELLIISHAFVHTLTEKSLLDQLDSKNRLLSQIIIQKDYERFVKFLSSFCKDSFTNELVQQDQKVYSKLVEEYPAYAPWLEIHSLQAEHRIEVIRLEGSNLTIGGYAFVKGLSTEDIQKELVFKSKMETKIISLENELRTDVSYLFAHNKINYHHAGFKTITINLVNLLQNGSWNVFLRLKAGGKTVDEPLQVILAQLRNHAKPNMTHNVEVSASFSANSQMSVRVKKVNFLEKCISKLTGIKRAVRYDMSFLKKRDYHTFSAIVLYKLFNRLYRNKNIWLIGERKDTAQDNSYHLYTYIRTNHPHQNAYYVIDKNAEDYQRIKHLGNIVHFNSLKHTFYLLVSQKTINSYSEASNMYTKAYKNIVKYYPEWQQNEKVFIQHGVIGVSRVNHVLHKNRMNYSQFVVSSSFEKKHIVKEFGYEDKEVVVTGLARWDALQDVSKGKEILVMPTWRNWIKTEKQLFESDYWNRYMLLFKNPDFNRILEERDLRVTFFPHYQMQQLIQSFPVLGERIRIARQGEETVQSLLKRHSMLITDYSTVSFDFAYMNKPVFFYQFDYDEFYSKHYNEGPINHKKDLFGERAEEEQALINLLERHPASGNPRAKQISNYIIKEEGRSHSQLLFQQLSGGK